MARGVPLPTIFITAYPEDGVRHQALAGGALGLLAKPFAAQDLIQCIDLALQRNES